jgi:hypothetical protein
MNEHLQQYRSHLVLAEQKAQEDFDKTVLSLSGGALGVSFAFVRDIVGPGPLAHPGYLFLAWSSWGISVTVVLASYFLSQLALRRAIVQVDSGHIYKGRPGGPFALATAICNATGGILFLFGVVLMTLFVRFNLEV